MNQTQRKNPIYSINQSKRFIRKKSEKFQRSIDSKKQSQQPKNSNHYIKTPTKYRKSFHLDGTDFFKQLADNLMMKNDGQSSMQRSKVSRDNYIAKCETLEAQIQLRNHEINLITAQYDRLKQNLNQQKQRRRKIQYEKKELCKQHNEIKKQFQKIELENKHIHQQKQYLLKQVQFLEKINFDQKTRTLQSYREKYLEQELEKLRMKVKEDKSSVEKRLQQEIIRIKDQKYVIESHYKALKIANECLIKQLSANIRQSKQFILNSQEYVQLRQKYKKFLEQYKQLRSQYWKLKQQANVDNQSSLLDITQSD